MNRRLWLAAAGIVLAAPLTSCTSPVGPPGEPPPTPSPVASTSLAAVVVLQVDDDRWPLVADHIADAQLAGESAVCTLDRDGAEDRRDQALEGIPTRPGFDRDEYPHAVCEEGGAGSDVRYVPSGENRSHGSWLGRVIADWPDGTRVAIAVVE
jgi:hypothetical protein